MPVPERLREQRVDRLRGLRTRSKIPGVRPGAVIGHDLQPRPAFERDRPQLGPVDRRRQTASLTGRHGTRKSRIEQQITHFGEDDVQGLRHAPILPRRNC